MSAQMTSRQVKRFALAILGVLGILLGWSAQALASTGYVPSGTFGSSGSGDGQFQQPSGVAVNDLSGDVYVYDAGNRRVEWFNSTGSKFEGQFNGSTSTTGQFAPPATSSEYAEHGTLFNLAIDNDPSSPSVGDVYVVDPGHNVIDKFSATGAYLSQLTGFQLPIFGVAVDTEGNVWVAEEGKEENGNNVGTVHEFDDGIVNKQGSELTLEKLRSPGTAVDSKQNLYLLKGTPDVVQFTHEGALLSEAITNCGCDTGLAVDAGTDELLVDEGTSFARFGPFGQAPEEKIEGLSSSRGIAVNGSTHTVYVSQRETNQVVIFELVPLPEVITGSTSEIHRTTAKLEGEVNPGGEAVTSCRFEYATSAFYEAHKAYEASAPCIPTPGAGTSPVEVSAEVAGLSAQTTYHYRLVAGNAHGPRGGTDSEFTTLVAVENTVTEGATVVTATSATLQGSFEPNGFETNYDFEYSLFGTAPSTTPLRDAGSATEDKHISAEVSGLTPNAFYIFRILGENQFGQTIGGYQFFKTLVVAPTIASVPSATAVRAQSAVVHATLNPEHTMTEYHFEYGACATLVGCPSIQNTTTEASAVYGQIGTAAELVGLAPSTTYSYRLVAKNEFEEPATGAEATFTTGQAPSPLAETGAYSALTSTSVLLSGMVDPDGLPASYTFEIGVYNGASTQYGPVASGSAGTGGVPIQETHSLTSLQPGTTYAYRIAVASGYIDNETHMVEGAPVTFTTPGLTSVLAVPPPMTQLATPSTAFPRTTTTLTTAQRLAIALRACKSKPKKLRMSCQRKARKRYPIGKKK